MCGIAGIWQLDGRTVERPTIRRFTNALAHRGPDGEGLAIHDEGRLALGHRRLAILDLSDAGHAADALGERPLRNHLQRRGLQLPRTASRARPRRLSLSQHGDTEVVLAAFEHWGPDCLRRFNGMWSFAIWDHRDRSLFLSRDRFGIKPLYVAATDRRFAFASELKAFLHLDGFDPVVDIDAVTARLADNFADQCCCAGCEAVPRGTASEVTPEDVRSWRWWNTLDHLVSVPADLESQAEEFRALLFDACRLRLRCDVPVATSLSGGLDSSSVLCSLAAASEPACWRSPGARMAAGVHRRLRRHGARRGRVRGPRGRTSGSDPGRAPVVRRGIARAISTPISTSSRRSGGCSEWRPWALYREMRRDGVVVSLDGHGGDELLGGYGVHIMLARSAERRVVRRAASNARSDRTLRHDASGGRSRFDAEPGVGCRVERSSRPRARPAPAVRAGALRLARAMARRHSVRSDSRDAASTEEERPSMRSAR